MDERTFNNLKILTMGKGVCKNGGCLQPVYNPRATKGLCYYHFKIKMRMMDRGK